MRMLACALCIYERDLVSFSGDVFFFFIFSIARSLALSLLLCLFVNVFFFDGV